MNYEEKYNQAIDSIKRIYEQADSFGKELMEKEFPELRDSEDEQHRKWILEYLYDGLRKSDEQFKGQFKTAIAWLEKQGEQNTNTHLPSFDEAQGTPIIKQEEQKPYDKVEPKFKVGDWVRAISSGNIFKILSVNDGLYRVLCYDGVEANYPIEEVEKDLAYWTIQDAKDGDVLCGYSTDNYPWIGIFHELNDDETFKSYCFLQAGITGKFCPPSGINIFNRRNVDEHNSKIMVPATKEQCDFLFQKMKEAGYGWDAEKKELKKIEQIARTTSWEERLYVSLIG